LQPLVDQNKQSLVDQRKQATVSKRKKDGVFYTPKYITKYIVENTIGKLCEEKKTELAIDESEYLKSRKGRTKKKLQELDGKLDEYRNWLLSLTICDPACGSGAFLNQALDFLIREHRYIDELRAKLLDVPMVFTEVENSILENNIYGVDINEESVEIAKLSLWLRTAQKGRKLTTLSNNIKCGNSLIDDPEVAGEKAFNWQNEFPEVFENGGFDVVIGNPPYVSRNISEQLKAALKNKFKTAQYQLELYVAFIETGNKLLKNKSFFSFIIPNSWLKNMMMSECRKYILDNFNVIELIPSLENVFPDASVDTMIFVFSKEIGKDEIQINEVEDKIFSLKHTVKQNRFYKNQGYIFDVEVSEKVLPIINKMASNVIQIGEIFDVTRGINPYDKYTGQSQETIKNRIYHADYKKDETFVPELKGLHLSRYNYNWDNRHFISYGDWLAAPREPKYFTGDRIIFREILGKTLVSTIITEDFKIDRSLYIARIDENKDFDTKYVLGILNSKLMAFYFRYSNNEFDNLFPKIRVAEFKQLPIKIAPPDEQNMLSVKVEYMLILMQNHTEIQASFHNLLEAKFDIEKFSKKLKNWSELEFKNFLKELKKAKVKLTLSEEAEWMHYFNEQKLKAQSLKSEIDQTDREIDRMVYELYGLTEEEIGIVEESIK
jgi:tRNA1(Val) A37 N6-methylase TrmN6